MSNASNAVDLDCFCSKFLKSWQKIAAAEQVIAKGDLKTSLLSTFCTKFQQEYVMMGEKFNVMQLLSLNLLTSGVPYCE